MFVIVIMKKNQKDYNSPFHKLEIIHIGKEKRELDYFEDFYIKYYNSYAKYQLGYNIAKGGTGGNLIKGKTDEEIMKIRRKQSESLKGNQNAKGKILSK